MRCSLLILCGCCSRALNCWTEAAWTVVLSRGFQLPAVLMKNKFCSWPEQQRGMTSIGPIIVPCVATNGVGCDIAILLSGLNYQVFV